MNEPKIPNVKEVVKEKYGQIALQTASSCCGSTNCCGDGSINMLPGGYEQLDGYVKEADLGLGCGFPTLFAKLAPGETVLDLGSGAGNDVFVARRIIGESGKVIGVDMTPEMIARANENKFKMGYSNVDFRLGEIEQMPVDTNSVDVVLSNCVLNLVPNKRAAFGEIHRVLKPGGRFSISDIVLDGQLPEGISTASRMYVGCVSGASQKEEYLDIIRQAGLTDVQIPSEKVVDLPREVLLEYATADEVDQFIASGAKVLSITVTGHKPA